MLGSEASQCTDLIPSEQSIGHAPALCLCVDLLCVLQVSAVAIWGTWLKSPHVKETEFLSALVLKIDFWFRQD